GTTIQYLITGKIVGDFMMGNDIYNVLLQSNALLRKDPANLRGILIQTNDNSFIPLSNFAALKEKISVKSYNHYNTSRAIAITCNLKKGVDLAKAQNILEEISKEVLDKNNSRIEYEGNIKQMSESFSGIIFTFCLALVFIFLVLAAQFESFLDALLILITVPFSITGGVVALYFFGSTINMYSNIGFATLIGLVTKNAIMIIEFANQLRMHKTEGHEPENSSLDAVIKSAYLRFRPIIMTSIATIVGAVPLVLATGAGAAARNSIGLVITGGMSVGTIFTIFVIPVLYASCKK
ncbi:MAG: efflux RND transporter permease subunit, partial [Alphaproteobacteria bacterium]|nr:efflux RND transporter permease subunit [Alphaproteobacteria bacterium]